MSILAEELANELRQVTGAPFAPGRDVYRALPGGGCFAVTPLPTETDRGRHLFTLLWDRIDRTGLGPIAWGLFRATDPPVLVQAGRVNARGQFWCHRLRAKTEYMVRYAPWVLDHADATVLETVGDATARAILDAAARAPADPPVRDAASAAAARLTPQPLTRPAFDWSARRGALHRTTGGTTLRVEDAAGAELLRVRLLDEQGETVGEWLAGMAPTDGAGTVGEVALGGEFSDGAADGSLSLYCHPVPLKSLRAADAPLVSAALRAATGAGRLSLTRANYWLRTTFAGDLGYAPAADRVTAVLPPTDAALDAAVDRAIAHVTGRLREEALTDEQIADRVFEATVGTAELDPADRLRLFESIARRWEHAGVAAATAAVAGGSTAQPKGTTNLLATATYDPRAVLERARRLAEFEARLTEDDTDARVGRLARYAGRNDEEIAELLGRAPGEIKVEREAVLVEVESV